VGVLFRRDGQKVESEWSSVEEEGGKNSFRLESNYQKDP